MSKRAFTIKIFMADGRTDGIKIVRKGGWDGVGVVCPRVRYFESPNLPEFKRDCVYILIGDNDEVSEKPHIYVGETTNLGSRLTQHAKYHYWNQIVVFTSEIDGVLNRAYIKYLESKLYKRAKDNKRCNLKNRQEPRMPRLSLMDKEEVEGYLHEMLSLLSVLNIRVFESAPSNEQGRKIYSCQGGKGAWNAYGYETNNGFVVQKGSIGNTSSTKSMKAFTERKHAQVTKDKIIVKNENGYRFTQNYEFNSPSEAASIVRGHTVNGLTEWKDKDGVTLKKSIDARKS